MGDAVGAVKWVRTDSRATIQHGAKDFDVDLQQFSIAPERTDTIGDRVYFLHQGRILEHGLTEQIFGNPQETRKREFLQRVTDTGRF